MAIELGNCKLCGQRLEILRQPVKRLRWSRYWWKGFASWFSGPLGLCSSCGAIYSNDGELLAAGAVQTDAEQALDLYRRDMAYLRDSFGGVIVAAELAALWLIVGADPTNIAAGVIAASVGVGAFAPFAYFGKKVRRARKQLREMKSARIEAALRGGKGR